MTSSDKLEIPTAVMARQVCEDTVIPPSSPAPITASTAWVPASGN